MFSQKLSRGLLTAALFVSAVGGARADVFNLPAGLTSIEFVTVGNPGNPGELSGVDMGTRICGAVNYTYNIGKYEVTAGHYCEFLNAVAATDKYGLYNTYMDYDAYPSQKGCNIKRTGTSGSYTYSVAADWANRPVNYVSWGDAARFMNWLTNGQPTGNQNLSTTENGSYYINGATSDSALLAVYGSRMSGHYYIPSEDEWYKAAYYDPNKPGGAGYWEYPTRSDFAPPNILSTTGTKGANYYDNGYTIGSPYYRTDVGAFSNSPSAYGTFDQGGNVMEWNEAKLGDFLNERGIRGGTYQGNFSAMGASVRSGYLPTLESSYLDFRVVYVPEPGGITLLLAGIVTFLLFFRRHWNG